MKRAAAARFAFGGKSAAEGFHQSALAAEGRGEPYAAIRYELRAQTPGAFHALPLIGQAMYVPEIRANGAELRVRVE